MLLVLSWRQALYAVLEKCFLCWKHTKKSGRQRRRLWSQCGVDRGYFSWRSFRSRFARTMGMKSLWRCQSNDLVPCMLLSSSPLHPHTEPRDNFLNFTLFCKTLNGAVFPRLKVIFPLSEHRRAGGWTLGYRGLRVGDWGGGGVDDR